jgi:hypothetical protein
MLAQINNSNTAWHTSVRSNLKKNTLNNLIACQGARNNIIARRFSVGILQVNNLLLAPE